MLRALLSPIIDSEGWEEGVKLQGSSVWNQTADSLVTVYLSGSGILFANGGVWIQDAGIHLTADSTSGTVQGELHATVCSFPHVMDVQGWRSPIVRWASGTNPPPCCITSPGRVPEVRPLKGEEMDMQCFSADAGQTQA